MIRRFLQPKEQPQAQPTIAAPQEVEPNAPKIPDTIKMTDQDLTYQSGINLGGAGKMELFKDNDDNEWLFKPAKTKSGKPEEFRAYVHEAGYKAQGIVDPDTAVVVASTIDGVRITLPSQAQFEIYSDVVNKNLYSMSGYFRVKVPVTGNTAADRKALEDILDKSGLKTLTVDPTEAELDRILSNCGIPPARVDNLELQEIFPGYSYRIIIDPSATNRTNWYAYDLDCFGTTKPGQQCDSFRKRDSSIDFIKSQIAEYSDCNEIMFRHGIPTNKFIGISCEDSKRGKKGLKYYGKTP